MERNFILSFVFSFLQVTLAAQSVTIQPEVQTVRQNDQVKILCKFPSPLIYCRFVVPGIGNLNLAPSFKEHKGAKYFGNGLQQGDCGVQINNVKDANNGYINCTLGVTDMPDEPLATMKLTVATSPPAPILDVKPGKWQQGAYKEDETLEASCRVVKSRPASTISWYIDDEKITSGLTTAQYIDDLNDLKTTMQNLSLRLRYTDNGKNLRCVAGHIAQGPGSINQTLYKIGVVFPPKPSSQEYERFGFIIGSPGDIKVVVHANPRPEFVWQVGNEFLRDSNIDSSGRLTADHSYRQNERQWEAILHVSKVTDEEVDKRYILIAKNELGQETYNVAISTSPAPPKEITTGAIVGIIIAVLVIVLLLFMIIFARATGRWCFAGGAAPHQTTESTRKKKNDAKAPKSLTYVDYKLVLDEDGKKKYVSQEEAAQLQAKRTVAAFAGPSKETTTRPIQASTSVDYVQIVNADGRKEYVTLEEAEERKKQDVSDVPKGILRKAPLAPPPPPPKVSTLDSDSFKSFIRSSGTTNYESLIESSVDCTLDTVAATVKDSEEDTVDAGKTTATSNELSLAGIPKVSKDVKVSDWLKEHREAGDLVMPSPVKEIKDVRDLPWIPSDLGPPPPVPSPMELKKSLVTVPLSSPQEVKKVETILSNQGLSDINISDAVSDSREAKGNFKRGWSEGSAGKKRSLFGSMFASGRKTKRVSKLDVEFAKNKDGSDADSESSDSETNAKNDKPKVNKNDRADRKPRKTLLGNLFGSKRERKRVTLERSLSEPNANKRVKDSFTVGDDVLSMSPKHDNEVENAGKIKKGTTKGEKVTDEKKSGFIFPLLKSKSSDQLKDKKMSVNAEDETGVGLSDSELAKGPKKTIYVDAELSPMTFVIEDRSEELPGKSKKRSKSMSSSSSDDQSLKGEQFPKSDGEGDIAEVRQAKKMKRRFSFPSLWKPKGKNKKNSKLFETDKTENNENKGIEAVRLDSGEPVIVVDNINIRNRKEENDDEEEEIIERPYLASFLSVFTPVKSKSPKGNKGEDGDYYRKVPDVVDTEVNDLVAEKVETNSCEEANVAEQSGSEKILQEDIPEKSKSIGDIVKEILGFKSKDEPVLVLSAAELHHDNVNSQSADSEHDKMRDIVGEIFRSNSEDSLNKEKKKKKKVGKSVVKPKKKSAQTYVVSKSNIGSSSDESDKKEIFPKRRLRQERSFQEDTSDEDSDDEKVKKEARNDREGRKKPLKVLFGVKGTYRKSEDLETETAPENPEGKPKTSILSIFGSGRDLGGKKVKQGPKNNKRPSVPSLSSLDDGVITVNEANETPKRSILSIFGSGSDLKGKKTKEGTKGDKKPSVASLSSLDDEEIRVNATNETSKKSLLSIFGSGRDLKGKKAKEGTKEDEKPSAASLSSLDNEEIMVDQTNETQKKSISSIFVSGGHLKDKKVKDRPKGDKKPSVASLSSLDDEEIRVDATNETSKKSLLSIFGSGRDLKGKKAKKGTKQDKKPSAASLSSLDNEEIRVDETNETHKKSHSSIFGSGGDLKDKKVKHSSKGDKKRSVPSLSSLDNEKTRVNETNETPKKSFLSNLVPKTKDNAKLKEGKENSPLEGKREKEEKSHKSSKKGIMSLFKSQNRIDSVASISDDEGIKSVGHTQINDLKPSKFEVSMKIVKQNEGSRLSDVSEINSTNRGQDKSAIRGKKRKNHPTSAFGFRSEESSSSSSDERERVTGSRKIKELSEQDKKILSNKQTTIGQLRQIFGSKENGASVKKNESIGVLPNRDLQDSEDQIEKSTARNSNGKPSKESLLRLVFGSKESQDKRVSLDELKGEIGVDGVDGVDQSDSEESVSTSEELENIGSGKKEPGNKGGILSFLRNGNKDSGAKRNSKGFYDENIKKANKKNNRKGFYDFTMADDYVEPKPQKKDTFAPYFLPKSDTIEDGANSSSSASSSEEANEDLIIARPAVGVWGPKRNEEAPRGKSWEFDEENEPVVLKAWKQLDDEGCEVKDSRLEKQRPSSLLIPKIDKQMHTVDKKKSRPLSLYDVQMTRLSDTESADHGSTDKSSVSKLTQNRSSKPKFGFLDLLKRPKDKVMDIEDLKAVAEAKDNELAALDAHGRTNADGVVYAELDIVRSAAAEAAPRAQPEPEKTEYAEIIHPRSTKKAAENLKKSRENLAGSREALNDPDPDVTTTPEGKKEAAV